MILCITIANERAYYSDDPMNIIEYMGVETGVATGARPLPVFELTLIFILAV